MPAVTEAQCASPRHHAASCECTRPRRRRRRFSAAFTGPGVHAAADKRPSYEAEHCWWQCMLASCLMRLLPLHSSRSASPSGHTLPRRPQRCRGRQDCSVKLRLCCSPYDGIYQLLLMPCGPDPKATFLLVHAPAGRRWGARGGMGPADHNPLRAAAIHAPSPPWPTSRTWASSARTTMPLSRASAAAASPCPRRARRC